MRTLLIASLFLIACSTSPPDIASPADLAEFDRAVLEAVLTEYKSENGYEVVSYEPSEVPDDDFRLSRRFPRIALKDLKRRTAAHTRLPELSEPPHYRLVEEVLIRRPFEISWPKETVDMDWRWKQFYEHFPGSEGIVSLSYPGYTPDYRVAVVYLVSSRGLLHAQGSFVRLVRSGSNWRVVEAVGVWAA